MAVMKKIAVYLVEITYLVVKGVKRGERRDIGNDSLYYSQEHV